MQPVLLACDSSVIHGRVDFLGLVDAHFKCGLLLSAPP